jgi:cytochrome c-type biogenesis protein CcmE
MVEGGAEVEVFHRGDPPELFADDSPVVCEGRWDGETFQSDRIMIKHGSTYQPPPPETDS